jgi:ACS family hexuronate transporter-like MFS transporter
MDDSPPAVPKLPDHRWRWVILGLLFVSTFLNYFDRQTLSVLKPTIKAEFGLNDAGYANIVTAFLVTYIIAYTLGGRFVDRVGSRIALTLFVGTWSLANVCTGLSNTLGQLTACRVVLGAAEPGNYPAALRAAATWFPAPLRGFATSFYQAGSATAAVLALPLIALMATHWGWRTAFVLPGVLGLVWAVAWWMIYRSPSAAYAAEVSGGQPDVECLPWSVLLRNRNLWGIVLARLVSDQVWYFCLFWMPGYLQENLHLSLMTAGLIGWIPFLCADLGGVGSGLVSDRLVRGGRSPAQARKLVLLGAACLAPLVAIVPFTTSVPLALAAFCVVATVCQVWLFNITTLVADVFPRTSVASVLGVSGSFGALGGLINSQLIGHVVDSLGFKPVFLVLAVLHLLASVVLLKLVSSDRPAHASVTPLP